MPETDTQIWMALREQIETAAAGRPVSYPAEPFTVPDAATEWLAVGDVATSTRAVLDSLGPRDHTGIISLAHVAPLGYTHEWYIDRAAGLLAFFPLDGSVSFGSVSVHWGNRTTVPRVERGYRDGGWYRTPALIPWRCFAA